MAESLAIVQRRWADHVRDPSMPAPDGVEARRMAVYRRLCIDSLDTHGGQPAATAGTAGRSALARSGRHTTHIVCHTPLFPQIASEFAAWLAVQYRSRCPAGRRNWHYSTQQTLHIEARDAGHSLQSMPAGGDCWRCRRWCGYWATGGRCMRTPRWTMPPPASRRSAAAPPGGLPAAGRGTGTTGVCAAVGASLMTVPTWMTR